ncbi:MULTISPECIES: hypothetical protein [Paraburkholderia]|uniref:Uncharacterized protein n=2 Tax=Paraburkholderia TaxID=1822464 RepID=A0ABW9D490_9BURK|nr:hypothetical protein [Paraburkholderia bryophila]NYH19964.1 putative Rossmann-fold nucleotide-binding protein [Paraburkholderia bryophila]NYH20998.1 putative Rossmann-fold nucleotide-binding protein [Paraburkholderia bryophila]
MGERFWRRAFDVEFLVDEGMIAAHDTDLFCFAEAASQIWRIMTHWYEQAKVQQERCGD